MAMLRQITPRNARSKRALDQRAPKAEENPKTCLFLRGTTASQVVQDCLTDLHAMRAPLAKKFSKKNDVHPFEDAASLEFFSRKNDASLLVFGSSSKKRRHCLTLCRTFDYRMLDMLELYVDETSFQRVGQFAGEDGKKRSIPVGARPMLLFAGSPFYDADGSAAGGSKYALAKSLLTDLFRGDSSPDKIDVEGLSHIVVVTAAETEVAAAAAAGAETAEVLPVLHIRVYALRTKRSGHQRLPRVELEEIGPRLDVRLGRAKEADSDMLKEATRRPKTSTEARTKKNIETDGMGDKIGRIHLGRQDLGELQTRKMRGLKRQRGEGEDQGEVGAAGADKSKKDELDGITGVVEIKNDFSKKAKRS